MLLTIEKVIVLKGAEVFSVLPDHVLAYVASIVEEVYVRRGETFIRKGDIGDCMYLIVQGTVLVHDADRAIAEMGKGQTVGELAVLDPEPRVASVTAVEDTSPLPAREGSVRRGDGRPAGESPTRSSASCASGCAACRRSKERPVRRTERPTPGSRRR